MDSTTDERKPQRISLLESLNGEWIKLPLEIMQDVGPAVQTLGGLLKVTNKETYSAVADIAAKARLPLGTVRKHLHTLDANGWVNHRGREKTRRGWLRRTATIALTKQTRDMIEPYAVLPWWACCSTRKAGKLPWSAKAVVAVVLGRLMSLKAGAQDDEELIGAIDNMGGENRFQFSLDWLEGKTGLTRHSLVKAKRRLHKLGIVRWSGGPREDGGSATHLLVPNWDFRVIDTPAGPGKCWVDFDAKRGGCKSGQ
jgi:hypothetical protein